MTSQSLDTCPILKNFTLAVSPVPPPTPTNLRAGAGGGEQTTSLLGTNWDFLFLYLISCVL